MLAKYAENPKEYWRSKDAALYLVTSLVSRGATQKHGVTQTSQLVDINQFCEQQVLPELERPDGKLNTIIYKTNKQVSYAHFNSYMDTWLKFVQLLIFLF